MQVLKDYGSRIAYTHIIGVTFIMAAVVGSSSIWSWIHDDEEEDLVRFRQRLVFAIFWSIVLGLLHIRNSSLN